MLKLRWFFGIFCEAIMFSSFLQRIINKLAAQTRAVTAIEYALIAALIAVVIVVAVSALGTGATATFTAASNGFGTTGSSAIPNGALGSITNPYTFNNPPPGGSAGNGQTAQCGSATCQVGVNPSGQTIYFNPTVPPGN